MDNAYRVETSAVGDHEDTGFWIDTELHRNWLKADAKRQLDFFRNSRHPQGGFYKLDATGAQLKRLPQLLYSTSRIVHSYALASRFGYEDCAPVIDHGITSITRHFHDSDHGGYFTALRDGMVEDDQKLAYGHVFVLLAASSAMQVGHPDAAPLLDDITNVLTDHFWDHERGVFSEEFNRDWTPFSSYRGFNANMHGTEALLAAFEATGNQSYLDMARSIISFFVHGVAPENGFRLPEHFTADWAVDRSYSGVPNFRPSGTTPGHSFEMARLVLQYWDLSGRKDDRAPSAVRRLVEQALSDAWVPETGGLVYTLGFDGKADVAATYWWPVTEAICVLAALIALERRPSDEQWYRRLWVFADKNFVDHERGGWHPEIRGDNGHTELQFTGKPDVYHSLQAALLPLTSRVSGMFDQAP